MAQIERIPVEGRLRSSASGNSHTPKLRGKARADKSKDFVCYLDEEDEIDSPTQLKSNGISYSFVEVLRSREIGNQKIEKCSFNQEFPTCHLLTYGLFKESPITLGRMNKVFSAQWLSENQVVFGTKCNKLMVYDVIKSHLDQIPSLSTPGSIDPPNQQCGIHSVKINPSKTLLATGARNSHDVAVYKLPTFDPVCVGEVNTRTSSEQQSDIIFDIAWLDDMYFVTGSRDNGMALFKVQEPRYMEEDDDGQFIPRHEHVKPIVYRKCKNAEKVRALVFNPYHEEIAALSLNAYIHVWDACTFKQKYSRKLPHTHDNVCFSMKQDGSLYAVGSKSHTTLIDPRTLQPVATIASRYRECGIRSTSFRGNIVTIGASIGILMFYDIRAGGYVESSMVTGRGGVVLKATKGWVYPDELYRDVFQNIEYSPAIYTHCYDETGTRLFAAGGPLPASLYGNYAAVWQ